MTTCYYCKARFRKGVFLDPHSPDCPMYQNPQLDPKIAIPVKPKKRGTLKVNTLLEPVAKPRMTRSDKWKKRPSVVKYFEFKDRLRERLTVAGYIESLMDVYGVHVEARITMPKSWPKYKKAEMSGHPHRSKPDADNILKAVCDALTTDDSGIYQKYIRKQWSDAPGLDITLEYYLKVGE